MVINNVALGASFQGRSTPKLFPINHKERREHRDKGISNSKIQSSDPDKSGYAMLHPDKPKKPQVSGFVQLRPNTPNIQPSSGESRRIELTDNSGTIKEDFNFHELGWAGIPGMPMVRTTHPDTQDCFRRNRRLKIHAPCEKNWHGGPGLTPAAGKSRRWVLPC